MPPECPRLALAFKVVERLKHSSRFSAFAVVLT